MGMYNKTAAPQDYCPRCEEKTLRGVRGICPKCGTKFLYFSTKETKRMNGKGRKERVSFDDYR